MSSPYGLELVESCLGCKLPCRKSFCALPQQSLEAFEKIKLANLLPKGATLYVAGQKPGGIYLVCVGKVKLCTTGANGRTMIVSIAGPGDVLGLHACVLGTPHEFTAETVQASQIVFVRVEDFLAFLKRDDQACWKAAQVLSRHCQEAHKIIRGVCLARSASEKLARLMLDIAGQATREGIQVDVALTHKEIAQAIGMSRETVWRKLNEFRNKGLAVLVGSTLLIQNKAGLERLAGQ
jgi:CRP/FNR family transcriptional regulator, cyclic AMP receptor protein